MFGSKKASSIAAAVFDISSSSVGGAHTLIQPMQDTAVTILASFRVDAPLQEDLDMKRFVSDTVHNLENCTHHLQKADVHAPRIITLVLASPWYVSQTRSVVHKSDKPIVCTKKFLHELVDAEIERVIKNDLERFGTFGKEGVVVEKQISLVKLNGYTSADPIGKQASMVELYLTLTVAPKKIIEQFTTVLHRAYGNAQVMITTSPYATFVVARDFLKAPNESFIVDVGEEVTDVAFIKEGLFLYQHSFPVGTYGLYRALSDEQDTSTETKALLEAYRLQKASQNSKNKIEKALATFSTNWSSALQKILDEGYFGFCLPSTCYLTADPRFETFFSTLIASDPFISHTCSKGAAEPHFLTAEMLSTHVRSIDETYDIPLVTAALYTSRTM